MTAPYQSLCAVSAPSYPNQDIPPLLQLNNNAMSSPSFFSPLTSYRDQDRASSLLRSLNDAFGDGADAVLVRVPGRVNLIGEHIDYCGYSVHPMAIEQDVLVAVRKTKEPGRIRLRNRDREQYPDFEETMAKVEKKDFVAAAPAAAVGVAPSAVAAVIASASAVVAASSVAAAAVVAVASSSSAAVAVAVTVVAAAATDKNNDDIDATASASFAATSTTSSYFIFCTCCYVGDGDQVGRLQLVELLFMRCQGSPGGLQACGLLFHGDGLLRRREGPPEGRAVELERSRRCRGDV